MRTYTTNQVAARTGATFRQLNHWAVAGVLHPVNRWTGEVAGSPGSGTHRLWTEKEIALAKLTLTLRELGAPIETIKHATDRLRHIPLKAWAGAVSLSVYGDVELGPVPRQWAAGWTVRLDACAAPTLAVAS